MPELLSDKSMDTTTIEQMIRAGLPDAQVEVSGDDGVHFEAVVVSPSFSGLATLKRHRMVYATLGSLMGREIHALGLRTMTPEENGTPEEPGTPEKHGAH
jgi:acid stress-induced BolA-like protein IbaG/YrbA